MPNDLAQLANDRYEIAGIYGINRISKDCPAKPFFLPVNPVIPVNPV
jgi:hypothetical protein